MPGPKYPVVDSHPDLGKVQSNFSPGDYATWIGITLSSLPLGYFAGKGFRGPSTLAFGVAGFLGGYFLAAQKSYGRLTGYLPNENEVETYGKAPPAKISVVAYSLRR